MVLLVGLSPETLAAAKKKKKSTPEPTAVPRPADPYRVTIPTADGVALAATFHPIEGDPKAPGVLLINDFSRERREWEPFAGELRALGLATLSFDLELPSAAPAAPAWLAASQQPLSQVLAGLAAADLDAPVRTNWREM